MSNTLLTISMITREALRVLENNLSFTKGVNREYDDQFGRSGAKIGDTLNIRKPVRYIGRTGTALAVENVTETSVPLVLNTQRGVDMNFTSKELALSIDEFSKRIIKPAIASIANAIDADGLALYQSVYNAVGTPGTAPTGLRPFLDAGAKMDNEACPRDDQRSLVIDPYTQASVVDNLKGLFQSSTDISKQYRSGQMGTAAGFDWSMDQNCQSRTVGTAAADTITVNGASQTGAVLTVAGLTGTLNVGDVFTIAGVYAVNPQNRQNTGQLRQFVVTANTTGGTTIPIAPAIVTTGAYQNVTASPASLAPVTVLGVSGTVGKVGLAYHRDAFTFACADLQLPGGVDMAARVSDKQLGMSIRMVRAYDINQDQFPCRLDILYGWKAIYPELACRIESGTA